jgi:hypothetical protein
LNEPISDQAPGSKFFPFRANRAGPLFLEAGSFFYANFSKLPRPKFRIIVMKKIVKKHPLAIRWFHWVNFPALAIMIWSGLLIYLGQ